MGGWYLGLQEEVGFGGGPIVYWYGIDSFNWLTAPLSVRFVPKCRNVALEPKKNGRVRIRAAGLSHAKQTHYQLRYTPRGVIRSRIELLTLALLAPRLNQLRQGRYKATIGEV